jgi:hypothetical protein
MVSHAGRFTSVLLVLGAVLFAAPAFAVNFVETKILPSDGEIDDNFAWSLDIWGDYMIVGSIWDNDSRGSAYLYRRTSSGWTQWAKLGQPGTNRYGQSVAISANFAVVSTHISRTYPQGAVFVYKRIGGSTWAYHSTLVPPDNPGVTAFGHAVAVDGGFIAVSDVEDTAHGFPGGKVYVYRPHPDGTQWILESILDPGGLAAGDLFGMSLSLKGYTLLVGAEGDEGLIMDAGAAYVYNYQGISQGWTQTQKLQASDGALWDGFGRSVALSPLNDWAIVGAYLDNDKGQDAGAAYLFQNQGGTWVEWTKLTGSDSVAGDEFGKWVGIEGDRAVVGAWKHGANGPEAGAAYYYEFEPSTDWVETKILASDGDAGDWFGKNVAMHGLTIAVGATRDETIADDTGAVYVYEPVRRRLIAPNIVLNPWPYLYIYTGYAQTVVNEPLVFDFITPEDVALSVEVLRQPRNGAVRFDRRSNALVYTPQRDFAGSDTFSLLVRDKRGNANEYVQEILVQGLDGRVAGGASKAASAK